MWKRIGDREELTATGIMRIIEAGHGILKHMYRKPVLLDNKPYYRYYKNGKPKWTQVARLVEKHYPGTKIKFDLYWYRLMKHLVAKHNILKRMQYALSFDELERVRRSKKQDCPTERTLDIHDLFQNDVYAEEVRYDD